MFYQVFPVAILPVRKSSQQYRVSLKQHSNPVRELGNAEKIRSKYFACYIFFYPKATPWIHTKTLNTKEHSLQRFRCGAFHWIQYTSIVLEFQRTLIVMTGPQRKMRRKKISRTCGARLNVLMVLKAAECCFLANVSSEV